MTKRKIKCLESGFLWILRYTPVQNAWLEGNNRNVFEERDIWHGGEEIKQIYHLNEDHQYSTAISPSGPEIYIISAGFNKWLYAIELWHLLIQDKLPLLNNCNCDIMVWAEQDQDSLIITVDYK